MTELDEKTERLTRLAYESDLGGIVLGSQPGFAWLTGGGTNRIDASREAGNGALFVRADGRRFVIANTIEMPRLIGEELDAGWEPIEYPWTDEHADPDTLARLAGRAAQGRARIGADWPLSGTSLIDGPLARARALLTAAEVPRYRGLGYDAGVAVGEVCRGLLPGTAETAIARMVSDAAASIGGHAVVVLVAADERIARFRHPVPTTRVWQKTVMVAACIEREGLVVALSRLVSADAVSADLAARTRAAAHVFNRLVEATRPGTRGRELFNLARDAYREAGFAGEETRHHQGGAIGYRSREWVAHPASGEEVQARQAFAWNPSITGTKVEDTALLTERGIELITTSPDWPLLDGRASGILVL